MLAVPSALRECVNQHFGLSTCGPSPLFMVPDSELTTVNRASDKDASPERAERVEGSLCRSVYLVDQAAERHLCASGASRVSGCLGRRMRRRNSDSVR